MGRFIDKTFWQVISENRIEIPVIQRDYAQGRKTVKIEQIREKFVAEIIMSLKGASPGPLHLDFVYGRITGKDSAIVRRKSEDAIASVLSAVQSYANQLDLAIRYDLESTHIGTKDSSLTCLIPLDGQQRLTTLFLLHWYILNRIDHPSKKLWLKTLEGFSYSTRKSSKDFCQYLTSSTFDVDSRTLLSQKLVNHKVFFNDWEKDPTVHGMLVMLDLLHLKLKGDDQSALLEYWNALTVENKITFHFLDLDTLEQTDELYVKMNARGKQLTDFEHFKASLYEYCEKQQWLSQKWKKKLDKEWTDLFWQKRSRNSIDNQLYNFIKSIGLYSYIDQTPKDKIHREFIDKIRDPKSESNFIAFENFAKFQFFNEKSLNFTEQAFNGVIHANSHIDIITNILRDIYCKPFSSIDPEEFILQFVNKNQYPDLWSRTYYYAFILFVADLPDLENSQVQTSFRNWMRICRNLIFNTYIQNPENFIDAIKALTHMAKFKYDFANAVENDIVSIPFYSGQVAEEKQKLQHFKKGNYWANAILEYENHPYFYGQIKFMFDLIVEQPDDFELFTQYGKTLSSWFIDGIQHENLRFQRALLTKGDYLIKLGKHSFCTGNGGSLRSVNDNWRKVFGDKDRLKYLKNLLDDGRDFKIIIDDYTTVDWKYFFIKYPKAIKYCSERYIDFQNALDIKLLSGSTYNSKHTDLYLYVLYLKIVELFAEEFNYKVKHNDVNYYRTTTSYPQLSILDEKDNLILSIHYDPNLPVSHQGFIIENYLTDVIKFENVIHTNNEKEVDIAIESICTTLLTLKSATCPTSTP